MYMTLLHWIVVAFFTLLFLILSLLSLREKRAKIVLSMIFSSFLITALGAVISLFIVDKYTKQAKILSYTQKRNLSSETMMLEGKIRNIGDYKIGSCTLEIKFSNHTMKMGGVKESFFKPSSSLGPLFSKKDQQSNTVKQEFKVVKNLKAHEVRSFRIYMKYPPQMQSPGLKLSLICH